jgi:hypothetical protein
LGLQTHYAIAGLAVIDQTGWAEMLMAEISYIWVITCVTEIQM